MIAATHCSAIKRADECCALGGRTRAMPDRTSSAFAAKRRPQQCAAEHAESRSSGTAKLPNARASGGAGNRRISEQLVSLRQTAAGAAGRTGRRRAEEAAILAERLSSAETFAARLTKSCHEAAGARATALSDAARRARCRTATAVAAQSAEHSARVESLRAEKERLETRRRAQWSRNGSKRASRTAQVDDDAAHGAPESSATSATERSRHEIERARNESEREHLRESCVERTQRAARRSDRGIPRSAQRRRTRRRRRASITR